MLQFIFQLGQVLNNSLALFPLLLVGHVTDGSVEVVDGTGLGKNNSNQHDDPNSEDECLPG